ncbi:PREDICTED: melanoma-associated antigen B10 [Myotis davidii]|uniref:Melanoma-associated antigen B10 n=1 Tax=Myotis davidii TaxID=225400 RepID=L5LX13_MYODS|nr:PREDICTED: melanoma-associated antigen B10 [Myotis davidii]ELK30646.1 Melanoma-associated antigen B10 [Myotis davidii]
MPRGQKSKLRARKKRRQAREESWDPVDAQATASEAEEESSSSPSPDVKDDLQSSPASGTPSSPQVLGEVYSTTASAEAVSSTRFTEDVSDQLEEMLNALHTDDIAEYWHRGPLDEKVIMLVHYLLYKYQRKEPITKVEMIRNVIQVYKRNFHEIFKKASEYLEVVFGLDMKEMDPNRNTYVLINKLELSCDSQEHRGVPKTGVLMTILGVIFMKGNCATEEDVWKVLNMMGLHDGRDHFIFGDPKKLITEDLVKNDYLVYRQVPDSDPPHYEFLWGPRAHAETSKMKVLEFVAKANHTSPSAFPTYYEEALRDEKERAQAKSKARAQIAAMASARSKAMANSLSLPK